MHISISLLLLSILHCTHASHSPRAVIPKVPKPEVPEGPIPNSPRPGPDDPSGPVVVPGVHPGNYNSPNPGSPSDPGPGFTNQMGKLEDQLEHTNEAVGHVKDVVDAILSINQAAESTFTVTESDHPTFTPSTTLPVSFYTACLKYASKLSSCVASTPSFYALPASSQAECACYISTSSAAGCTVTITSTRPTGARQTSPTTPTPIVGYATQRYQTLVPTYLDGLAGSCYSYFSMEGYAAIPSALDGTDRNGTVALGRDFCGKVVSSLASSPISASRTGTAGLKDTVLDPSWVPTCTYSPPLATSGASSTRPLSVLDRSVLIMVPVLVATTSFIFFALIK